MDDARTEAIVRGPDHQVAAARWAAEPLGDMAQELYRPEQDQPESRARVDYLLRSQTSAYLVEQFLGSLFLHSLHPLL